jgi:hypothetical protein
MEKNMKKIVVAAVLAFSVGPVAAQDLGEPVSSGSSYSRSWDGVYVGLAVTSADVSGPEGTRDSPTQGFGLQFGYLRDFGKLVAGGEFAYVGAEFDDNSDLNLDSTRLKAIGGFDAGRFMPYAFVGVSNVEASIGDASISEAGPNYGLGGRVALGAQGQAILGLEYLVEEVSDFGGSRLSFDNNDMSLRLDFRY